MFVCFQHKQVAATGVCKRSLGIEYHFIIFGHQADPWYTPVPSPVSGVFACSLRDGLSFDLSLDGAMTPFGLILYNSRRHSGSISRCWLPKNSVPCTFPEPLRTPARSLLQASLRWPGTARRGAGPRGRSARHQDGPPRCGCGPATGVWHLQPL